MHTYPNGVAENKFSEVVVAFFHIGQWRFYREGKSMVAPASAFVLLPALRLSSNLIQQPEKLQSAELLSLPLFSLHFACCHMHSCHWVASSHHKEGETWAHAMQTQLIPHF